MTKNILLVNRFTCSNLGDQEIANCYENFLLENYNVKVHRTDYTSRRVTSLNLNSPLMLKPIKNMIKKLVSPRIVWISNVIRIFCKIKKSRAELVLIGGGQLIMPGVFCLAAFIWTLISKLCGRNVVMANVGAGGNFDCIDRWLIRRTMFLLDGVSFRDEKSSEIVRLICAEKMPAPVSTSDIVYTKKSEQGLDMPRNYLALAITDWSVFKLHGGSLTRHEYYETWMQLLIDEQKSKDVILLVYATAEDYKETLLFRKFVQEKYNLSFAIASIETIDDLRYILSTSRSLISGRMHSLLFAAQCHCAIRPYFISDKIVSFYSDFLNLGLKSLRKKAVVTTRDFLKTYLKN
tara:strand:- start:928 stop:1974 length:1047 start_codon:yes stop_codon:yes gene_type:complete